MRSDPHIADPDAFYEAWLRAHEGLDDAASDDLNARLVLLLANQIGDLQVLLDCIEAARGDAGPAAAASPAGERDAGRR